MSTFRERYCESCRCRPEEFPTRIFWRCLHPHAVPFVPFLSALQSDYFAPDRDLILNASRARSMRELDEDIRDYMQDSRNHRWWRMRAHVRLSTQRLRGLARRYFAEEDAGP